MRSVFSSPIAALAVVVLAVSSGQAFAQAKPAPAAQEAPQMKQMALTEKQIENLLAAQKEIDAITDKLPEGAEDKPNPKLQTALDAAAKKNGFASYDEYSDVAANISLVLSGIDPKTKTFTEPPVLLKKQIADLTADKTVPDKDKKEALAEMNEALKYTSNVQYPANVALVTKYFEKLSAALKEDE